jgi:glycine hydroxymethyltransferase
MPQVAAWMDEAVTAAAKADETALNRISAEVSDLLAGYPMPGYTTE